MAEPFEYLMPKNERVRVFWRAFCSHAGISESTPYQCWHFGDSAELASSLVEQVVNGPKRATAGLLWAHERDPRLAPVDGGYSVVTEHDGTPRAVIRTTQIDVRRFGDVDAAFAWDEGEGDRTLDWWRDAHRSYFTRECAVLGREASDDMPVVLERFELLYAVSR
jgi:uncharacterized protein YhfF